MWVQRYKKTLHEIIFFVSLQILPIFTMNFSITSAMYTVYALFSPTFNKIYIGFTSNLEERFLAHNQFDKKGWTIRYRPWIIIHTEVFDQKAEAMKREQQLKSAKGRAFIRSLI
jgi:putative endonuclease